MFTNPNNLDIVNLNCAWFAGYPGRKTNDPLEDRVPFVDTVMVPPDEPG